jgi:hypothetical protein
MQDLVVEILLDLVGCFSLGFAYMRPREFDPSVPGQKEMMKRVANRSGAEFAGTHPWFRPFSMGLIILFLFAGLFVVAFTDSTSSGGRSVLHAAFLVQAACIVAMMVTQLIKGRYVRDRMRKELAASIKDSSE